MFLLLSLMNYISLITIQTFVAVLILGMRYETGPLHNTSECPSKRGAVDATKFLFNAHQTSE